MKKRDEVPFNLSFLDVMCCGLGAVILLVLILSGRVQQRRDDTIKDLQAELVRVTASYHAARADSRTKDQSPDKPSTPQADRPDEAAPRPLAPKANESTENAAADVDMEINRLNDRIKAARKDTEAAAASARDTERAIKMLEKENDALENATKLLASRKIISQPGARPIGFTGDGQRQYLTGIKLGGERTLILVDASASMLDELIVNIVRRKLMSPAVRREAPKWARVVRTVHWLVANLPSNKRFQVYVFNTDAQPVIAGTDHRWLSTSDADQLSNAVAAIRNVTPDKGTSLHQAFAVARRLNPAPDSIILLTDGLPTQGFQPTRAHTISGDDRLKLFEAAVPHLPEGIPINTLLFPIEGDPAAAEAFWRLAIATNGSFITPSRNWP
jgi:von Willebrand factor type A domain